VFETLGLSSHFNIQFEVLERFLMTSEASYSREVYYHNCIHAADVTNSVVFLLHNGLMKKGRLGDIDILSLIISAICHDIGHPGKNNAFLVASKDKLAIKYNDRSVLENMHCSTTFKLLSRHDCNITANLTVEQWGTMRKIIVGMILATDL
jgi:hypothetical protein